MSGENQVFCSLMLRQARAEAKEKGIVIPKLGTYNMGHRDGYEVYPKGHDMKWYPRAYNASDAKASWINEFIEGEL